MGQAKLRGSREARVAEALAKIDRLKPTSITCNQCRSELTEIGHLNTRGMDGIEVAFIAHCENCNQDTYAVRGEPYAVEALYSAMAEAAGEEIKRGTASPGGWK